VALINGIRTFLTAKAVPVAAATLLVGGGAALAAPGVMPGGDDVEADETVDEEEHDWAIGRADEEQLERIEEFCGENPDASFCSGVSEDPISWVPGALGDEDSEESDRSGDDSVASEEDEDGRSETARRVHEALTGDPAIVPGDPRFGPAVSEGARTGQLGGLVSRAARGEEPDDDALDLGEPRRPGPPDHAKRGPGADDGDAEATATTEAEPKAERRGPPPAASRGNSGNSGNSGPQGRGPRG